MFTECSVLPKTVGFISQKRRMFSVPLSVSKRGSLLRGNKMKTKKFWILLAMVLMCGGDVGSSTDLRMKTAPQQRINAPFRLFQTENIWTYLLLDTQYGRVWQVAFGIDSDSVRQKLCINGAPLTADGKVGRFTLYPTDNLWTFLLLDQEDGRVWQCQFSTKSSRERFILPIPELTPENPKDEQKQ